MKSTGAAAERTGESMGFSDLASTTVFNSVLVPTTFGSTGKNVPQMSLAEKIQKSNTQIKNHVDGHLSSKYKVRIKIGSKETELPSCTIVNMFRMSRNVEKYECGDYTVNFPGAIKYEPVMFTFLYSGDTYILDWLKAGLDDGGSYPVNLIIELGFGSDKAIFTLLDAHLSKWEFLSEKGLMPKLIGLRYLTTSNALIQNPANPSTLVEKLTFNYSGIEINLEGKQ